MFMIRDFCLVSKYFLLIGRFGNDRRSWQFGNCAAVYQLLSASEESRGQPTAIMIEKPVAHTIASQLGDGWSCGRYRRRLRVREWWLRRRKGAWFRRWVGFRVWNDF